ncbi:MAG TPA: exopolyphosphatase [Steroidobacteraceae bacterium]|nr:exopolyphosphatase [Steroidobacteraceae bacterium]
MADRVPDVLAAVDLGSNSFHMIVARHAHGQLVIVDRLRESVRLAAGLDEQGHLSRESMQRALQCLERFGQRLRDMRAEGVRAVGTNTLRKARRRGAFMDRAREALGHPIEIISGVEEARLIYLGVAHTTPQESGHRLVVDVGGGSTELIVGEALAAKRLESLYMGCVSLSARYFPDGEITEKRMRKARTAAQLELEPVAARFKRAEWDVAYGSSGTLRAIGDVLKARDPAKTHVDREGLEWLLQETLRAGHTSRIRLPGLTAERQDVLPGGLAIVLETFDRLGIEQMRIAEGALREGLLYDLLGRLTDEDARARSVRAMEARFHVESAQADRVEATALDFLRQVRADWHLDDPLADPILGWAARLHEIGLDISHSHHHRHGAYLLQHADMPGFPHQEQQLLAAIVGGHRRKLQLATLDELMPPWHTRALYLVVLLRLAVLLHRGRGPRSLPDIRLVAKGRSAELCFPRGWLADHPLTAIDLEQEAQYLQAVGFRLRVA